MNEEVLGALQRRDDRIDLTFERFYPRPVEKVWSALTDPARLGDWMGAAYVEPRVGGRYELMLDGPHAMRGRILAWEPPKWLEYSWSNPDSTDSVVRWELFRDGDRTRLLFTHKGIPHASGALMAPGWHFFLARLENLLDGASPPRPEQSWRELQAIYVDRYEFHGLRLDPDASGG